MSLIRPSGVPKQLGFNSRGYSINPWIGCACGCAYCWSKLLAKRFGRLQGEWTTPKLDPAFSTALAVAVQREALRLPSDAVILMSATTDPFQPDYYGLDGVLEEIFRGLVHAKVGQIGQPRLAILTKSATGLARFLEPWLWDLRAEVGVTVTSLEPNTWEPDADEPGLRLGALRLAAIRGLPTYVIIEPWLPDNITIPQAIIEASRGFVNRYVIGALNYFPTPPNYYRERLPPLRRWIQKEGLEERVAFKPGLTTEEP